MIDQGDMLLDESADFESTSMEVIEIIVDKGQEQVRIDKYLLSKIKDITRSKIQSHIDEGNLTVNGQVVKSNYKIRPADVIIYNRPRQIDVLSEILPENIPLDIVYEDEAVVVVNKASNMVVHPGSGNYTGTLVNALAYHFEQQAIPVDALPTRIGLVHRIDKDTTGLLLVAKTEEALVHLQQQFKAHTVHRRYVALVWGNFEEQEGTIEGNIGRHERFRKLMDVFTDTEKGKPAITHYQVLEDLLYVSLLYFRLETGRTHQIRVHAKYIGHPLFNDATYGGDRILKGTIYGKYKQFVENCFTLLPRQALHAKELGFIHPVTGAYMQFDSEIPADMQQVIEKWRSYIHDKR